MSVLRGRVLAALPTVAGFEARLADASPSERAELVEVADAVAAHRFDLLGSGPVDLGPEIDWRLDFKSGRRWPAAHISKLPVSYPDGSDIKVPWELSRFQHLPVLAAAWRLTGEGRYLDEIGAQLVHWIEANPVEFGPNWASTMDVAIRASNWVATLAMCAGDVRDAPWLEPALESLLLHGRFIRGHLEWAPARGNHYLSDVVGLLPVAGLFHEGEGSHWATWASRELVSEMEHQVRADGCDHEASLPYHRLVCELFVCGTQAADALAPGTVPDHHRDRLERMLGFVGDYTRPDGLAPQIGDADDGRFLPLDDYGRADPRDHRHLFAQAGRRQLPAEGHAAYPDGGYWVMRAGEVYAIVRCGDVGVGGIGSHAHNDQLSFELALGDQPLVVDPGSYLYTADPEARDMFRSTAFHSTLRIGGAEQNSYPPGTLFATNDDTRATPLSFEPGPAGAAFEGRHHGYERLGPPAVHTRRLELTAPGIVTVTDTVEGPGAHELEWTFPLAKCAAHEREGTVQADFPAARLQISSPDVGFGVEPGWYSPRYGVRERVPFVRGRRRARGGVDVTRIELTIERR